jgi:hypothetical protein
MQRKRQKSFRQHQPSKRQRLQHKDSFGCLFFSPKLLFADAQAATQRLEITLAVSMGPCKSR